MKPTLVFDSLSLINSDSTNTTTTLTPTTLKTITQIFESDDCLKNLQHFDQGGFIPPPPPSSPPSRSAGNTNSSRSQNNKSFFNLAGGTTTIVVPQKSETSATRLVVPKTEDSFSSEDSEESDDEYRPQPKMLKRFGNNNTKAESKMAGRGSSGAGNKRKGNRKDDYDGLSPEEQHRLKSKREKNKVLENFFILLLNFH